MRWPWNRRNASQNPHRRTSSRPLTAEIRQWIERLPKLELHVHLEGSIDPGVLYRIAGRHGLRDKIPTKQAAESLYDFSIPDDFFQRFLDVSNFVRSEQDIADIVEDAARRLAEQNCLYVEWTFAPQKFVRAGIPYPALLEAIEEGLGRLDARPEVRIIIDLVRNLGHEEASRTMQLVRAYPHPLVTGIGLGGTEEYGPEPFAHAFEMARDLGLGVTAHAGETAGPESIRTALDSLKVDRIDHGVRAMEEQALIDELSNRQILLNLCPTSNQRLGITPDFDRYPLRCFVDAGIPITIGSDDPPFFETTLTDELALAVSDLGLTLKELIDSQRRALEAAFVDEPLRVRLRERFERDLSLAGPIPVTVT